MMSIAKSTTKALKTKAVKEQKVKQVNPNSGSRSGVILHPREPIVLALASKGIFIDTETMLVMRTFHDDGCSVFTTELTPQNVASWCSCTPSVEIAARPNRAIANAVAAGTSYQENVERGRRLLTKALQKQMEEHRKEIIKAATR
jgi:hypothetical protein